jgi:hypothetical protein
MLPCGAAGPEATEIAFQGLHQPDGIAGAAEQVIGLLPARKFFFGHNNQIPFYRLLGYHQNGLRSG